MIQRVKESYTAPFINLHEIPSLSGFSGTLHRAMLKGELKLQGNIHRVNPLLPHRARKQQFCLCDEDAWGTSFPNRAGGQGLVLPVTMLWAPVAQSRTVPPRDAPSSIHARVVRSDSDLEPPKSQISCGEIADCILFREE